MAVHAVVGFDPVKDGIVACGVAAACGDAVVRDQAAGEIDEGALEHALCAIGAQHGGIGADRL